MVEVHRVTGAQCELNVLEAGAFNAPAMVLLHGMRDHAQSLLYLQAHLPGFRLIIPDLRGHGDSDKPGTYSLLNFVSDLKAVFDHFEINDAVLVGHSLGGHIGSRFTYLYPGLVSKLILLDGMGPPGEAQNEAQNEDYASAWHIDRWRNAIAGQLGAVPDKREMADEREAVARLMRNNSGLSKQQARHIVRHGVDKTASGCVWKWDARVDQIWMTFSHADSELAYRAIQCPVLLVTGEWSLDYWASIRPMAEWDAVRFEIEQQGRTRLFADARWVNLPAAGHMLHYDQPERVANCILQFALTGQV